jgi:hypothetical protein
MVGGAQRGLYANGDKDAEAGTARGLTVLSTTG